MVWTSVHGAVAVGGELVPTTATAGAGMLRSTFAPPLAANDVAAAVSA
jgi:hypothetical protein